MEVTYRNRFWDLVWFNFYQTPRMRSTQIMFGLFLIVFGYIAVGILNATHLSLFEKVVVFILILVAFLFAVMILQFIYLVFLQIVSAHQRLQVNRDCKLSVSDDSVVSESAIGRSEIKWSGIVKIHQSKDYILVYISERAAVIIPKRSFANKADADKFFSYSRQLWENAKKVVAHK